ncbi:LuxR C-terminal-related transcriptional regulator [Streptomyces sp. NPDC055749]
MVNVRNRARSESADHALALYQELRARGASSVDAVLTDAGLTPEERARYRDELLALGLIVETDNKHDDRSALKAGGRPEAETDDVAVIAPEIALLRLLEKERARLSDHLRRADEAYGTLEALAGRFLKAGALSEAEVEFEVITDYRRIQQALEDITDVVQHDLCSMHPTSLIREISERSLSRDERQLERGIRVRSVYNQQLASSPGVAEHLRRKAELGVEVRLSAVVPMNMIVADERYAVLPVDPDDPLAGAVLARGPALVRSYRALYDYCWQTAAPYGAQQSPAPGADGLTDQQRAALRMLASGMKDEKIARGLGVSLRTVSRLLSEVMHELGASSRFEAGVRATRLGLLD